MNEEVLNKVKGLFHQMYPPHSHEYVCGYEADGKDIVVFRSIRTNRQTHVYLSEKQILMPFFPKKH